MRSLTLTVVALATLTACKGDKGDDSGIDCDKFAVGSQAWEDYGCSVDPGETATVNLSVFAVDQPAPCGVWLDGEYAGFSDGSLTIPAGVEVLIQLGNQEGPWTDEDNTRPIHDQDGLQWVSPDIRLNVEPDKTVDLDAYLNRYLYGNYACSTLVCINNGSTCDDPVNDGPLPMKVVNGEELNTPSSSSINWLDIVVEGDQLIPMDDDVSEVVETSIEADTFYMTLVDSVDRTVDIGCMMN